MEKARNERFDQIISIFEQGYTKQEYSIEELVYNIENIFDDDEDIMNIVSSPWYTKTVEDGYYFECDFQLLSPIGTYMYTPALLATLGSCDLVEMLSEHLPETLSEKSVYELYSHDDKKLIYQALLEIQKFRIDDGYEPFDIWTEEFFELFKVD